MGLIGRKLELSFFRYLGIVLKSLIRVSLISPLYKAASEPTRQSYTIFCNAFGIFLKSLINVSLIPPLYKAAAG